MKVGLFFGAGAEISYGLPSGGKFAIDLFRKNPIPLKQCLMKMERGLQVRWVQKSLAILVVGEHNVFNNTHNASDLSVPVWVFL